MNEIKLGKPTSSAVGRQDEINSIKRFLDQSGPKLLNIYGQRGIGKTSLINTFLNEIENIDNENRDSEENLNNKILKIPYKKRSDVNNLLQYLEYLVYKEILSMDHHYDNLKRKGRGLDKEKSKSKLKFKPEFFNERTYKRVIANFQELGELTIIIDDFRIQDFEKDSFYTFLKVFLNTSHQVKIIIITDKRIFTDGVQIFLGGFSELEVNPLREEKVNSLLQELSFFQKGYSLNLKVFFSLTKGIPERILFYLHNSFDDLVNKEELLDESLVVDLEYGFIGKLLNEYEPIQIHCEFGKAEPKDLAQFLVEISKLYKMIGGSGIEFEADAVQVRKNELI